MSFYHEITVWTRGIIMDKEARDVANCIAQAANREGRYTQYINDYVDAPDRTNCLIRKYARISDREIEELLIYENPHPDIVVLIEETLIKAVNYFRNTPPGQGVLVVNSTRDPEYLLKFVPERETKLKQLVVVDAVGLAEQRGASPWMFIRSLTELSYDRMSTEGSAEKRKVGVGIAAPLVGAVAAATGIIKVESLKGVVSDVDAMVRGAENVRVLNYSSMAPVK
jgi:Pyruvate/2-oxoacid:ferredoxin oxidoreductase gamma subunit